MSKDVITIIERAYEVDAADRWVTSIGEAVRPFVDEGVGLCVLLYDATAAAWVTLVHFADLGMPPALAPLFQIPEEVNEQARASGELVSLIQLYRSEPLRHVLEAFAPYPVLRSHYERVLGSAGMEDFLCINCVDPSALGCFIGVPHRVRKPLTPAVRRFWTRIAAHIAAGYRIQRTVDRLAGANPETGPGVEAVLETDGRITHAEGPATERTAREALRHAALQVDRARGALRREDPDAALEAWAGLISGRWSLVDRFDRDGRRYLLARRNDPDAPDVRGLTLRERQIVGYAALGHPSKLIAYELGLSQPTVSNHLASAARKLGVRSRAELVDVFARLSGGAPSEQAES
jgi:DNA-binding CsgD family transcriptional regulator